MGTTHQTTAAPGVLWVFRNALSRLMDGTLRSLVNTSRPLCIAHQAILILFRDNGRKQRQ